jgi:cyclic pyranopterin phosphate synthase
VLEVARIAGVGAAKQAGFLIPLCHPLGLDGVNVDIEKVDENSLEVRCTAITWGRTGVEMEAMTGASIAALTLYDMTKALSKGISIRKVELLAKSGGKSGTWRREE